MNDVPGTPAIIPAVQVQGSEQTIHTENVTATSKVHVHIGVPVGLQQMIFRHAAVLECHVQSQWYQCISCEAWYGTVLLRCMYWWLPGMHVRTRRMSMNCLDPTLSACTRKAVSYSSRYSHRRLSYCTEVKHPSSPFARVCACHPCMLVCITAQYIELSAPKLRRSNCATADKFCPYRGGRTRGVTYACTYGLLVLL
jgi:hypothetical protein